GGEQHVHLPALGLGGDVVGQADEVVGRLAHCTHDDDHIVALAARARDMIGDGSDAVGIGYGGAAKLLNDEAQRDGASVGATKDLVTVPDTVLSRWRHRSVNERRSAARHASRRSPTSAAGSPGAGRSSSQSSLWPSSPW